MQWSLVVLTLGLPLVITRHVLTESTGTEGARGLVLGGTVVALSTAVIVAAVCTLSRWRLTDLARRVARPRGWWPGRRHRPDSGVGRGLERAWFYVVLAAGPTLLAPAVGLLPPGRPSGRRRGTTSRPSPVNALTLGFGLVKVLGSGRTCSAGRT